MSTPDFRKVPLDKFGERLRVGDRAKFYGEPGVVTSIENPRSLTFTTHLDEVLTDTLPEDLVKT